MGPPKKVAHGNKHPAETRLANFSEFWRVHVACSIIYTGCEVVIVKALWVLSLYYLATWTLRVCSFLSSRGLSIKFNPPTQALNPKPLTLNPKPLTLNPKPYRPRHAKAPVQRIDRRRESGKPSGTSVFSVFSFLASGGLGFRRLGFRVII